MGRPSDWSVVDLPGDPVPGDPVVVKALAVSWSSLAEDAEWARGRVDALLADGAVTAWVGKAGEAFRTHSSDLPGQLDKASRSYRSASNALSVWSSDLDGCQGSADRGLALARQAHEDVVAAQRVLATARANETSAVNASRTLSDTSTKYAGQAPPAGVQLPDPSQVAAAAQRATAANNSVTTAQHTVDDAQTRLAAAKKMIGDAAHLRDDRANVAATAINAAADEGIPPDSFWDNVGDVLSDVWHGIVEIAKIVVLVGGIIAMIIGGPLAWIVFAAALLVLADTLAKYAQGKATLLDVGLALLCCIPMTKGLTTLGELSAALKSGGLLGAGMHLLVSAKTMVVELAQGIRAAAGGLKTIITNFRDAAALRGLAGDTGAIQLFGDLMTGGRMIRPRDISEWDNWAETTYQTIRTDASDVDNIAQHMRDFPTDDGGVVSADDIAQIKDHLFNREHTMIDYEGKVRVSRFDADPSIAEAWNRLANGTSTSTDRLLLQHELAESNYLATHPGATYNDAHSAANDVANWQQAITEGGG
jgi:hypothetical protein